MCFWMMSKFWHWVGTGAKCSYAIQKEMLAIIFIALYPGWIISLLVFLTLLMYKCNGSFTFFLYSCDWIVALFGWSELLLHGTVFYFPIRFLYNSSSTHKANNSVWFFLFFCNTAKHIMFICVFVASTRDKTNTSRPLNLLDIWCYCQVKISSVPFKWFLEWHIFF